jgi:hypothetical protein
MKAGEGQQIVGERRIMTPGFNWSKDYVTVAFVSHLIGTALQIPLVKPEFLSQW